jgi:hypothetical protein
VCAALVLGPALSRPAHAQANSWNPPPPPPAGQPPAAGYPPPAAGYPPPQPREDVSGAMAKGSADGQAEGGGALWFFAGCALGVLGIVLGYVVDPTPPPERLIGKSPEWSMAYSNAYKSAAKSEQGKQAIIGCLVGTAVFVAIYVALVYTVLANTPTTTQ